MMKKVTFMLVLASIVGLAKASVIDDASQFYLKQAGLDQWTAVIPPGTKVIIDGKSMMVMGKSTCPVEPSPGSQAIWVKGMSNDLYEQLHGGRSGCVVIGPHTLNVSVMLLDKVDGNKVERTEAWTVQHGQPPRADAVALKRPNGEYVTDN